MRKSIILFFLIATVACRGQVTIPMSSDYSNYISNNNYIKDTNDDLNKFVGTWKWVNPSNPNTYFLVEFFKVLHYNPSNINQFYEDKILGNYKYVLNGVLVINTIGWNTATDMYSTSFPAIIGNDVRPLFKDLLLNMRDIGNHKTCKEGA